MSPRRPRHEFRSLGQVDPCKLDLPVRRARALRLEHAWLRVAGEQLARRATAVGIDRGILEIRIVDERWTETLVGVLPRLAGRLAAAYPQLKVRKFRLTRPDNRPAPPRSLPTVDGSESEPRKPKPVTAPPSEEDPQPGLHEVVERYVARTAGKANVRNRRSPSTAPRFDRR